MSERERWIVYPLLFLALGASLRDKLFDMTQSRRIVCQELIVADDDPTRLGSGDFVASIVATEPTADRPSVGHLLIKGQVDVVGTVNAHNYALRGIPIVPTLRTILPNISPTDLLRTLQRSLDQSQAPSAAARPAESPDEPGDPPPDEN